MDLTFEEIKDQVARMSDWTSSEFDSRIEDAINLAYSEILKVSQWEDSLSTASVSVAANAATFSLPANVAIPKKFWSVANDSVIEGLSDQELVERHVSVIDQAGRPSFFSFIGTKGVAAQPSAATTIAIVSSNSGDLTPVVRIDGTANGGPWTVTLQLNGTTTVTSTISFSELESVSKDADSTGYVTAFAGATEVARLFPERRVCLHNWYRLNRPTDQALSLNYTYRRTFKRLEHASDVPVMREIGNLLVQGAYANVLKQQRDFAKAQAQEGKFQTLLELEIGSKISGDKPASFLPDRSWLNQRRGI